ALLRRNRPKETAGLQVAQVPYRVTATGGETASEPGRLLAHRHCVAKHDHCLIAPGRRRVHFCPVLTVRNQTVEPDPGRQGRLTGTLGLLDITTTKTSGAVGPLPAKQRPNGELL